MCGITAIVDFGSGRDLIADLSSMHARIAARGPDGEGFAVADLELRVQLADSLERLRGDGPLRVGLAFRWLKIQDWHDAATQPMTSADGRLLLMMNGEIYNFRELREELESCGHRFKTASDTEVVLAAYDRWGCEAFARLNGMWSIVILDLRARKLVISRDRFGIKPLFYHFDGRRLLIGSEIKQLLAAGVSPAANRAAVTGFIMGRRPAPEITFFDKIFAQPAATYAEIDLRGKPAEPAFTTYWRLDAASPVSDPGLDEAGDALDRLLRQSVEEHLIARASIGWLLSGGLDSSLLAAIAAQVLEREGRSGASFSMILEPRNADYDESAFIDPVAAQVRVPSFKVPMTPQWLQENLPRISWTQEEPVAGIAVAGQFLVYMAAAQHGAKVVLDGQGADEIFAGYRRHQLARLRGLADAGALWELTVEAATLGWRTPQFFGPFLAPRSGSGESLARVLAAGDACVPPPSPTARGYSPLSRSLFHDVTFGNLKQVLAITDRNSMAHSIEARVPYVDRRVIEYAFSLPDRYKVGGGRTKRILRMVAARYLPPQVADRKDRIGFGAPIARWMRQEFRDELGDLGAGSSLSASGLVDGGRLRNYVEAFLRGQQEHAAAVWRLYGVETWLRAYSVV